MASINDSSALNALNEKDYINKLYDTNTNEQKKLIQENYTNNLGVLNQEQQKQQQQTGQYLDRTAVENSAANQLYAKGAGQKVSAGGNLQAALYQDNTRQRNQTALNNQQNQAVAEIDRQRQLQGSLYASQIKEAQANNDMQRAQALYEAAKAEDEQYLALRKQAATLMAGWGDNSILDSIAAGRENTAPTDTGESWQEVLKNENQINQMYDAQLEAQRQRLYQDYATDASELEAKRAQALYRTDQQLNDAYTQNLQKTRNYLEVQNAYGQASGTAAQAQLARDAGIQDQMTELRRLQIANDAGYGMEGFDLSAALRKAQADAQAEINYKRAQELYKAAEGEEQKLVSNQQFVGNQYANQGNYEMLGRLYGLTPDQVDRLMQRGAYAPVYYDDDDDGYYRSSTRTPHASPASSITGGGSGPSSGSTGLSRIEQSRIIHANANAGNITPHQAQALLKKIK